MQVLAIPGFLIVKVLDRELLFDGEERVAGVAVTGDLDRRVVN